MFPKQMSLLAALLLTITSAQVFGCGYDPLPIPIIQPPTIDFCSTSDKCCDDQTIEVQGSATIQATPDVVKINA